MSDGKQSRRTVLKGSAASWGLNILSRRAVAADPPPTPWKPHSILASALYGSASLAEVLPEVSKTGANMIDLWPPPHGSQRLEIDSLGETRVKQLLNAHGVRLGSIACYGLGPFNVANEFQMVRRIAGSGVTLVTGAPGKGGAIGNELKAQIRDFLRKLAPSVAVAEATGGILSIENHTNSMIASPDSIRWVGEIFMHPVPRGVPILESLPAITAEINRARAYLESLLGEETTAHHLREGSVP
jgi:hypothetical protein